MFLTNVRVGQLDLIYLDQTTLSADFTFPQPVTSAFALLQGFKLHFSEDDHAIRRVAIQLTTRFSVGQATGSVAVRFVMQDDHPPTTSPTLNAEIDVLVVGVP